MKVLQLCLRVPDPPGDGGSIAMKAIAESLMMAGASVQILAFNTRKHFVEESAINPEFKKATNMQTVYLDASVSIIPAFLNLFTSASYNIERFKSVAFEQKLTDLLKNQSFDIIQLESLFLAPCVDVIRRHSNARVVLRAHNVEYLIWERMAASCTSFFKKKYLQLLASRLRKYEISMLNRFDAILPITGEDEKIFRKDGCRIPIYVTPLGLDTSSYQLPQPATAPFSVFHLGSMDWMPNVEAVDWFISQVLPQLQALDGDVKVFLAGKNMPVHIKQLKLKNVVVEDVISNARKYMSDKTVMVVPLLSGSGMRVKILEGMAMGKTIISTRIGAEGIACTHLENILIADTAEAFVSWILTCKKDPVFCSDLGAKAALLAASMYDNRAIGTKLFAFYGQLLAGSASRAY